MGPQKVFISLNLYILSMNQLIKGVLLCQILESALATKKNIQIGQASLEQKEFSHGTYSKVEK